MAILYIDDASFGGPSNPARLQNALNFAQLNDQVIGIPPGTSTVSPATVTTTKHHTRPWGLVTPFGGQLSSTTASPVITINSIHIARYLELGVNVVGPGGGILLTSFTPGGGGGGGGGSGFLFNINMDITIDGCTGDGLKIIGNVFESVVRGRIRGCTGNGVKLSNDGIGIVSALDFCDVVISDNTGRGILSENTDTNNFNTPRHFRTFGGKISGNGRAGIAVKNGTDGVCCIGTLFEDNCRNVAEPQFHIISNGVMLHGCSFKKNTATGSSLSTCGIGGSLVQSNPTSIVQCTTRDSPTATNLFVYTGTNNTHMMLWGCDGNIHRQGGSPWTAHHCRGTNVANGAALNIAGISTG